MLIGRVHASREQTEFLAELHSLRPSLGSQFVENTAGVGFDCVLAHIKLSGDLAVAHALSDQFKDLKLAASDAELLSFALDRNEWLCGRHRDFLDDDSLLCPSQPDAQPDAQNGKGRRSQSAVDFDGMLDYQEPILSPL